MIHEAADQTLLAVESILDLNNHAVSYLCQGNHSATTLTLRAAIKSLELCFQQEAAAAATMATTTARKCDAVSSSSSSEPPSKKRRRNNGAAISSTPPAAADNNNDTPVVAVKKHGYVPIRSITVSSSSSDSSAASSSGCNNQNNSAAATSIQANDDISLLVVYDRAFDFPSFNNKDGNGDDNVDFASQQSKTRLAAILLYNLGLTYQREAVQSGKSGDLIMALKFYREAYMVLKSAWAKSDFKEVFVLLLALLNNMACIHATLSDSKDTHQCINWMNRAIASRQRSILSKEDYTFFSLNLSVFRGHQLRLASAA